MNLIDTHAHLCDAQFEPDRPEVLKRALESHVGTIVEIAESPQGWQRARDFSENPSAVPEGLKVFWTCGFHPHHAREQEGFDFDIMKKSAASPGCLAVGEIGLDYAKSAASKENQASLFLKCLEISSEVNKPVVIHCRDAQADTLRTLRSFFGGLARRDFCTGVIHCFSGDLHFAEACMDLGFYLGVDGPITYPSSGALRDVISKAPLDRIVLETDSPYLPPQDFRGKRNESSYIRKIADKLAEIFGKNPEEIAKVTTQNASKLFRLGKIQ